MKIKESTESILIQQRWERDCGFGHLTSPAPLSGQTGSRRRRRHRLRLHTGRGARRLVRSGTSRSSTGCRPTRRGSKGPASGSDVWWEGRGTASMKRVTAFNVLRAQFGHN